VSTCLSSNLSFQLFDIPLHFCPLQLILNKVLLLGSASQTIIGRPIVPDAAVHAVVEEHVSVDIPFQLCE